MLLWINIFSALPLQMHNKVSCGLTKDWILILCLLSQLSEVFSSKSEKE